MFNEHIVWEAVPKQFIEKLGLRAFRPWRIASNRVFIVRNACRLKPYL